MDPLPVQHGCGRHNSSHFQLSSSNRCDLRAMTSLNLHFSFILSFFSSFQAFLMDATANATHTSSFALKSLILTLAVVCVLNGSLMTIKNTVSTSLSISDNETSQLLNDLFRPSAILTLAVITLLCDYI